MSSPKQSDAISPLLIFGAGGHGRVLVDAALLTHEWHRILVSDRQLAANPGEMFLGIPLVTVNVALDQNPSVHIAIGNNHFRQKEALALGLERLVSVVHPKAAVSVFSQLATGCFVAACSVVGPMARVGRGVIINHGAVVDHDVEIGDFSHVAPNASLGGHAKLGNRVLIGSGAVVLPSVEVGDDVTVGAGSVVTVNLFEPGTYAGFPARRIS